MYVVTVRFEVNPKDSAGFMKLVCDNARNSLNDEPECVVFDVCHNKDEPTLFFLYEIYTDAAAFQQHLATSHFVEFDQAVQPMVVDKQVTTYDQVVR